MFSVVLFRRDSVGIEPISIDTKRTIALLLVIPTGYPWQYRGAGKIVRNDFMEGVIQISISRRKISHTKFIVQWFYGDVRIVNNLAERFREGLWIFSRQYT